MKDYAEIRDDLQLFNQSINEVKSRLKGNDKLIEEEQKISLEIKSLNLSVQNIAQRSDTQDATIAMITAELTELLERKEFDTTAFLNLSKKVKGIETNLAKDQAITVLAITELGYDNPLLNHQELLTETIKMFGFDNTINLSQKLNHRLIIEAIENSDPTIVLSGLMSLTESSNYN